MTSEKRVASLRFLCLAVVPLLVTSYPHCAEYSVKSAVDQCNGHLAAIGSSVLATTNDNYTRVCRVFTEYLLCVEPNISGCESQLLLRYHSSLQTYTAPPYRCAVSTAMPAPPAAAAAPTAPAGTAVLVFAAVVVSAIFSLATRRSH